jgi:hypothetical protein
MKGNRTVRRTTVARADAARRWDQAYLHQTRPAIAQRRAAARPGRNDVELWIFLAGRKVLDVAFFPSHTWQSGGGKHSKTEKKARRSDRRLGAVGALCAWEEQRESEMLQGALFSYLEAP